MLRFNIFFIIIITILNSLLIYTNSFAKRTLNDLLPLEKRNIISWVNKYCDENHETWDSLVNDGYIKCNVPDIPVTEPPLYLTRLQGFQSYSIHKRTRETLKNIIYVFIFIIYIFSIRRIDKRKKYLFIIFFIFILVTYLYFPHHSSQRNVIHSINTAIKENYLDDIKYHIIHNHLDPNKIIHNNKSLLDLVTEKGFKKTILFVSSFAPEINNNYFGKTKLITAIRTGNIKIVEKVLTYTESKKLLLANIWSDNAFDLAALNGNPKIIKSLYDHYSYFDNINIIKSSKVLSYALYGDNQETVAYLFDRLNDLSLSEKFLIIASDGSIRSFKLFIKKFHSDELDKLKYDKKFLIKLFNKATRNANDDMTEYLFESGYFDLIKGKCINDIVKKIFKGYTRIKLFRSHHYKILMPYMMRHASYLYVKDYTISKNIADKEYCNMICYAVKYNDEKQLKILLNMGVDPTTTDIYGYSAVDYAKEHYNKKITKILANYIKKL